MKKILLVLMIILSVKLTAQPIDTTFISSADSIDIRALVQKQIEEAQHKKSVVVSSNSIVENKIQVPEIKQVETKEASANFLMIFLNQPFQYQLYEVISMVIIGFVLIRRTTKNWGKSSSKKLKAKIGLMREEKVGGTIVNPKMGKIRKVLKDNLEIFKQDDKQLAKTARQLNVSQGELLLAARLKFFEMKKM